MGILRVKFLRDRSTYFNIEPAATVPKVHGNLIEIQTPVLSPIAPGRRFASLLWPQPTSDPENLITVFFFGDVENAVTHSPSAPYP